MTEKDEYYYFNKINDGDLSISPSWGEIKDMNDKIIDTRVRKVTMNLGNSSGLLIDKKSETKDGIEIHLKTTEQGTQEIKAYFYENIKNIKTLTIQRWMTSTGNPHKKEHITLCGEQLDLLLNFVKSFSAIPLNSNRGFSYPLNLALKNLEQNQPISNKIVIEYLKNNPSLIKSIIENEIDESDIVSLGYRKKQLKLFKEMLQNDNLNESDWQQFFEKNNWIFGYGLSYIFHNGLDEKKLEQVVSGFDFNSSGKRVDALLKTAGFINSLCFVEIKTHKTDLLKNKPYRVGCWAVSNELLGGIAQIQNTVSLNLKNFYGKTQMKDKTSGDITGEEFFSFQPKSFLIIGSLSQLIGNNAPNEDKFRSFELFRKNTLNPEIITFDELYERAKFIIDSKDSNHE